MYETGIKDYLAEFTRYGFFIIFKIQLANGSFAGAQSASFAINNAG